MSTDDTVASRGGCCLRLWGFLGGAVGNWSLWKRHPRTSCLFVGIFACLQFPACPGNFCLFCEPWRSHLAIVPPIADCQFWQVHRIFLVRRPLEAVGRASFVYTRNCEFPSVTCGCVWNFTAWSVEFYICVCPDGFANLTAVCRFFGPEIGLDKTCPNLWEVWRKSCRTGWHPFLRIVVACMLDKFHGIWLSCLCASQVTQSWGDRIQTKKQKDASLGWVCGDLSVFHRAFLCLLLCLLLQTIGQSQYIVYIYIYTQYIYVYIYIYIGNLYWCNFICIYT